MFLFRKDGNMNISIDGQHIEVTSEDRNIVHVTDRMKIRNQQLTTVLI